MKGKSLALGGETTAEFVFPLAWFRQHGVNDLEAFSGEKFISDSHDKTIALVLNGKADIGAEKNTVNNIV
jgi:ABC-type phosphate/phosphonate transport system substrate-binding protein